MRSSKATVPRSPTTLKGADRRKYPRSAQRFRIGIRLEPPVIFSDVERRPEVIEGTLINVSRGGALFSHDQYLAPHAPCSVEIYGAAGHVIPNTSQAHIVRTIREPRGGYLTGIQFSQPLRTVVGSGDK